MKPVYLLPLISIIVLQPSIAFGASGAIAQVLTPEQIQKFAQSVVLKITIKNGKQPINGSGVIIKKNGTNYTLVTNAHVVCKTGFSSNCEKHEEFNIMTPDKRIHKVKSAAVKILPKLDLSIIQFQSNQNYAVANFGDSDKLKVDSPIYASGFPKSKNGFSFDHGTIIANVKSDIKNGYTIFYDAATNPGMSGGGVFNSQGELIAIHGRGDRLTGNSLVGKETRKTANSQIATNFVLDSFIGMKIGINRGIPIKYLRDELSSKRSRIDVDEASADSWLAKALNIFIDSDQGNTGKSTNEAIEYCDQAIKINPDYFMSYYIRASLWNNLGLTNNELNDFEKVAQLQPTSAGTYLIRSIANSKIGQLRTQTSEEKYNYTEKALNDISKSIEIDPGYPLSYLRRAFLYQEINRTPMALDDLSKAIEIDSKNSFFLFMRSSLYLQDKKPSLALMDFNQAIKIDPLNDVFFFYRAQAKLALSDRSGAIADINQAINLKEDNSEDTYLYSLYLASLNSKQSNSSNGISLQDTLNTVKPGTVLFYETRASIKRSQGNLQGALSDYNEAIKIKPTAQSFMYRAMFKQGEMKDYLGAEQDYTNAINLKPGNLLLPSLYLYRGGLRFQNLQNKKGAIADLQEAVQICKQRFSEAECVIYTHTLSSIN